MRDFQYSNEDGVAAAERGTSLITKVKLFFRNLIFRGGVTSKVIGGTAGAGVKALDVGFWKNVDLAGLRKIAMDCYGSGACDVTVPEQLNNYPASRQQIIDAIRQSGYRRRP